MGFLHGVDFDLRMAAKWPRLTRRARESGPSCHLSPGATLGGSISVQSAGAADLRGEGGQPWIAASSFVGASACRVDAIVGPFTMSGSNASDLIGQPPDRRKLIAVVYADMVGYSRLIGLDDAGTLGRPRRARPRRAARRLPRHRPRRLPRHPPRKLPRHRRRNQPRHRPRKPRTKLRSRRSPRPLFRRRRWPRSAPRRPHRPPPRTRCPRPSRPPPAGRRQTPRQVLRPGSIRAARRARAAPKRAITRAETSRLYRLNMLPAAAFKAAAFFVCAPTARSGAC